MSKGRGYLLQVHALHHLIQAMYHAAQILGQLKNHDHHKINDNHQQDHMTMINTRLHDIMTMHYNSNHMLFMMM